MTCKRFTQDVADTRIKTVDFGPWLTANAGGGTISAVTWTVPTNVTASDANNDNTTASNYFASSVAGEYEIKCSILTDEATPQVKAKSFILDIADGCDG